MKIKEFTANADIVGRRVQISWVFDLEGTGSLADISHLIIRRKSRDFEFPEPAGTDPFLVYNSEAFPPTGSTASDLPEWEIRQSNGRTVVTVETASRLFGERPVEIIRRTTLTTFDLRDRPLSRMIVILDTGDSIGGLNPGTTYYYQLFSASIPFDADPWQYRSTAVPGEGYGMGHKLFESIPEIFRRHDVITRAPTPGAEGVPEAVPRSGQLRRFLDIFGIALDSMRSSAKNLLFLHDIDNVDYRFLSLLANWIGWDLTYTAPIPAQRHEIKYAPDLYRLIGTIPGVKIWIQRLTGWNSEVKEFIHNVFRTNAPENIKLWEIWETDSNGESWSKPEKLTNTDGFDSRPCAVIFRRNTVYLFWDSDMSGRREIWMQRLRGIHFVPIRVMDGAPDDEPGLKYVDENPSAVFDGTQIWLFWDSNRTGTWNIFLRTFVTNRESMPVNLTESNDEDRNPAAIRDNSGNIWVFWQSDRRGKTDIWARVFDGSAWSEAERITDSQYRDERPAAVVDEAGRIWLFWSSDLGYRSNIMVKTYDGSTWGEPSFVTEGPFRDMSPSAVLWRGQIKLFLHSNRQNGWQIWGLDHNGTTWEEPLMITAKSALNKDPATLVDRHGFLKLIWRSQQGGYRYKSRTLDVKDTEMISNLKTYNDRIHYTFDAGKKNNDWYAPSTVGVYLITDTDDPDIIASRIDRARRFIEPFKPLTVRFVWIPVKEIP